MIANITFLELISLAQAVLGVLLVATGANLLDSFARLHGYITINDDGLESVLVAGLAVLPALCAWWFLLPFTLPWIVGAVPFGLFTGFIFIWRRSRFGRRIRAARFSPLFAHDVGIDTHAIGTMAAAAGLLFSMLGGLSLALQPGAFELDFGFFILGLVFALQGVRLIKLVSVGAATVLAAGFLLLVLPPNIPAMLPLGAFLLLATIYRQMSTPGAKPIV